MLVYSGSPLKVCSALVACVTADEVVLEGLGGPDAELGAAFGVDAVADQDNGIEVEVLDRSRDLPAALDLKCCIFCNSCLPQQFPGLEHIPQVSGYYGLVSIKQLDHLIQRHPHRLPGQPHVQCGPAVLGPEQDHFTAVIGLSLRHTHSPSPVFPIMPSRPAKT